MVVTTETLTPNSQGARASPLPMHSTFGGVEGIELPAALALLLRTDLGSARERPFERCLVLCLACDLAADIADQAT